jgi:acyl-coenzyme A thioesterase PaaI-like protein
MTRERSAPRRRDDVLPLLAPEPGWSALTPQTLWKSARSFVSTDSEGDRLRVRYYQRDADGALVGKIWFGPGCQGPPGHAHGGSLPAIRDEAMGAASWLAGYSVVAARLTTHFRLMMPLGTIARLETRIDRLEGRKVFTHGALLGPAGELYAEAEGLFVRIELERFQQMARDAEQLFRVVSSE